MEGSTALSFNWQVVIHNTEGRRGRREGIRRECQRGEDREYCLHSGLALLPETCVSVMKMYGSVLQHKLCHCGLLS